MSGDTGFSPRVVFALAGLAVVLFGLALLFTGGGAEPDADRSDGANSYSRSAIGHRALFETLGEAGRNVLRAGSNPLGKLGDDGVLVVFEPEPSAFDVTLATKITTAKRVLLVLSKDVGFADPDHPGWIRSAYAMTLADAATGLTTADPKARLERDKDLAPMSIDRFAQAPLIDGSRQRASGGDMDVAIGDEGRYLLGERIDNGRRLIVLTDPEPLENQGILKGDNAAFALALFDWAGGQKAKFVFDETVHGFSSAPASPQARQSPLRRLLNFPGNLLAALALAAVGLLIGATLGRFGPPLPAPRERELGKRALIDSIASLMDFGGRHSFALRRYVEGEFKEAALALRAPPARDLSANLAWLDKAAADRGVSGAPSEMIRAARAAGPNDLKTLFALAQAAHRWKREMVHGTR